MKSLSMSQPVGNNALANALAVGVTDLHASTLWARAALNQSRFHLTFPPTFEPVESAQSTPPKVNPPSPLNPDERPCTLS